MSKMCKQKQLAGIEIHIMKLTSVPKMDPIETLLTSRIHKPYRCAFLQPKICMNCMYKLGYYMVFTSYYWYYQVLVRSGKQNSMAMKNPPWKLMLFLLWKVVEFSMEGLLDNLVNALIDVISMDFLFFSQVAKTKSECPSMAATCKGSCPLPSTVSTAQRAFRSSWHKAHTKRCVRWFTSPESSTVHEDSATQQ